MQMMRVGALSLKITFPSLVEFANPITLLGLPLVSSVGIGNRTGVHSEKVVLATAFWRYQTEACQLDFFLNIILLGHIQLAATATTQ